MSEIVTPKSRDPSSLDPMTEPWWTLPMAISWIIWRTPDRVRTAWRKYDEEFRDLNRLPDGTRPGTGLRSLYDIFMSTHDDAIPGTFIVIGDAARHDLWRRLQDGEIVANGIPVGSETRRIITNMEWLDLDSFDPNLGWPVDAAGHGHKRILRFNSVVVPSKDVVRIWSDLDNAPMITAAHQDSAPTQPEAFTATAPGELILSGRGAMERAIVTAFYEHFSDGNLPPGVSSAIRNEKIRETVKGLAKRPPNNRTIQRALSKLSR
jgi:hypothetical protein